VRVKKSPTKKNSNILVFTCFFKKTVYKRAMPPACDLWRCEFVRDSTRFLRRCSKPDRDEFFSVATRVGLGGLIAGVVGAFVKLIFIPIRYVITGSG
jgi:protein transport protein SEC61 subunit gamma-like protein